jgi:ParB family transcriptional regulator, chromosome partitioning protein
LSKLLSNSITTPGVIEDINISKIQDTKNVRNKIENTEELSISIQQKGLLQPILVRTVEGYFEIVAGNRRFQACKTLGWKKIACHVLELDDKQAFEVSLVENIQRKTLSPLDEASAFKAYVSDYGWGGVSELASRIGKSVSYITKRIKLLKLPNDVLETITSHTLDTSVAEELFSIKDKAKQSEIAGLIVDRRLSMRKARQLLKDLEPADMDFASSFKNGYIDHIKTAERSFDKTITALRIAMNSLREVINSIEDDWILYEILMQHKNMLHAQIDILLKEKRKLG